MADLAPKPHDPRSPYLVTWGFAGEQRARHCDFEVAFAAYRALCRAHQRGGDVDPPQLTSAAPEFVFVGGEFFLVDDGLTAEQRARVLEVANG